MDLPSRPIDSQRQYLFDKTLRSYNQEKGETAMGEVGKKDKGNKEKKKKAKLNLKEKRKAKKQKTGGK